ncbi:hypothetical protein Tco_1102192 [Tanacetum coccineum]
MRTKIELTLEQTQQGVSDEVLAETGSIHMLSQTLKLLSGIEDSHHGPSDAMHTPPQPLKVIPMVAAAGRDKSRFIATCSYSTDIRKDTMKAQWCGVLHIGKTLYTNKGCMHSDLLLESRFMVNSNRVKNILGLDWSMSSDSKDGNYLERGGKVKRE